MKTMATIQSRARLAAMVRANAEAGVGDFTTVAWRLAGNRRVRSAVFSSVRVAVIFARKLAVRSGLAPFGATRNGVMAWSPTSDGDIFVNLFRHSLAPHLAERVRAQRVPEIRA